MAFRLCSRNDNFFEEITKVNGNDRCADCNTKSPRWVSVNLGILLCIDCAGFHRAMGTRFKFLGTHISYVKSLTLDTWKEEWKKVVNFEL